MNKRRESLINKALEYARMWSSVDDVEFFVKIGLSDMRDEKQYTAEIGDIENLARRHALQNILKELRFNLGCDKYEARWNKIAKNKFAERKAKMASATQDALELALDLTDNQELVDKINQKCQDYMSEHEHYKSIDTAMKHEYPKPLIRNLRYIVGLVDDSLNIKKIGYSRGK